MRLVMTMQELGEMRRHSFLDDEISPPIPPPQVKPPPIGAANPAAPNIATGRQPRAAAVAATAAVASGLAASEAPLSDSQGVDDDKWRPMCQSMLDKLLEELLRNRFQGIFDRPVDPAAVPGYDMQIKNPMDLGTVGKRLSQAGGEKHYTNPQQFADDVGLVWSNAKLFNPKHTGFYQIAHKMQTTFDKMWRESGLAQGVARARRMNAGVPARQVYTMPEESLTPASAPRSAAPQRSGKSEGKKRRREDGDASAGSVRTGHARAGAAQAAQPRTKQMSREEVMQVAADVQNVFASEGNEMAKNEMYHLLQRSNVIQGDEVDFEMLRADALWELRGILDKHGL